MAGSKHPWKFPAQNMSDGTLRALGVLTALLFGPDFAAGVCAIAVDAVTAAHRANTILNFIWISFKLLNGSD